MIWGYPHFREFANFAGKTEQVKTCCSWGAVQVLPLNPALDVHLHRICNHQSRLRHLGSSKLSTGHDTWWHTYLELHISPVSTCSWPEAVSLHQFRKPMSQKWSDGNNSYVDIYIYIYTSLGQRLKRHLYQTQEGPNASNLQILTEIDPIDLSSVKKHENLFEHPQEKNWWLLWDFTILNTIGRASDHQKMAINLRLIDAWWLVDDKFGDATAPWYVGIIINPPITLTTRGLETVHRFSNVQRKTHHSIPH